MNGKSKRKEAVALGYNAKANAAPQMIGKGKGYVAEEIIRLAKENNIPIQEDPSLVHLLSQLEINQEIPQELYEVVAEIFAFIYKIDRNI